MFDSQLRRCSGSMWGDILRPRKLKRCRDFQKAKKRCKLLEDGTDLQKQVIKPFCEAEGGSKMCL